jgi:hypothetical protein
MDTVVARTLRVALVGMLCIAAACSETERDSDPRPAAARQGGFSLHDVAGEVGLTFRHGAFRWGVSPDPAAMMGSGVCWIDIDNDGWLDLYAVNDYALADARRWQENGGLPRNGLFRNDHGRFVDVSAGSGADLAVRGQGCVAADLNLDGWTDIYVTSATGASLLWNDGDGTFTEGAADAGVPAYGWYTGAAVGDVNRDGWPDLFVAGYADLNNPNPTATQGFPSTYRGVRDLLYLSRGRDASGHVRFDEVGRQAGLENAIPEHGLGATFSDLDRDGDLDLFVANDLDPNRLYDQVPWPGGPAADPAGLGFRFEELAARAGVADPNAGMGVATGDVNGDGILDLFVSNARGQGHAMYRGEPVGPSDPSFTDVRDDLGVDLSGWTGWGASWGDLDLDSDPDLLVVSGDIPVHDLVADAEPIVAFGNLGAQGQPMTFTDLTSSVGLGAVGPVLARGAAAADFDNDGDLDLAVNRLGGDLLLLENDGAGGNWLEVSLGGSQPGAVVTVVLPDGRSLVREVHAGSSYLSSEDPRVHFGLGDADQVAELRIRWPDGSETIRVAVRAGQILSVRAP